MKIGREHRFFCAGVAADITGDPYAYCLDNTRHKYRVKIGFKVALYLATVSLDQKHYIVSDLFGVSRATVSKYVQSIEDLRGDYRQFSEKLFSGERRVQAEFAGRESISTNMPGENTA